MTRYPFMSHIISRSCSKKFKSYKKYKTFLEKDFSNRCCYCNMKDSLITESFHIDHFIPRAAFEGKKDFLLYDYDNLMLSCPKCNVSKGDLYKGNLEKDDRIINQLFYNPVDTNYNDIFYRNYMGAICSDDEKGKEMIKQLKLYRPFYSMAWLLENLEKLCFILNSKCEKESSSAKKDELEKIVAKISLKCVKLNQVFRLVYMGKTLTNFGDK